MGKNERPEFLKDASLWKELRRRAKGCRKVAAPYIGEGASTLLPWKKGDVLVCALSKVNARAGNVCPAEIEKLRKKGVKIYVEPDLHAKVMRLEDRAIVGSANISDRSKNKLDEAGVVLRDDAALASIDAWFAGRMGDPVSPGLIDACKKVYRKPKWPPLGEPAKGRPAGHERRRQHSSSLWIISTQPVGEFPEHEKKTVDSAVRAARKKLKKPRSHAIDNLRWQGGRFGQNVKPEDLVIQVWNERGQHVAPHGRVLSVRRTKTNRGAQVSYVCVEYPQGYVDDPIGERVMTGGELRRTCRALGMKLTQGDIEREVHNTSARRALLGRCSPETVR
jgi:hypothetical protein